MLLKRLALAFVPAIAVLTIVASPAATLASCAFLPDVQTAVTSNGIVFVGKVISTDNQNTWATVTVGDVWRGPDQPAEVLIKGGPGGNAATSVDRTFEVGVTYLFFPLPDSTGGLSDNSCSSTTPWRPEFGDLRPSDAHAPAAALAGAGGLDFSGILGPIVVAVIVAGVLLAVGLLARSRQAS
jgi:hypothetical protein